MRRRRAQATEVSELFVAPAAHPRTERRRPARSEILVVAPPVVEEDITPRVSYVELCSSELVSIPDAHERVLGLAESGVRPTHRELRARRRTRSGFVAIAVIGALGAAAYGAYRCLPLEAPGETMRSPPTPAILGCALAGESTRVAPRALISGGAEIATLGPRVAIGFVTGPRDGRAVTLGVTLPVSVEVTAKRALARVVPLFAGDSLDAIVEVDGAELAHARTLVERGLAIGVSRDELAWAPRTGMARPLAKLDGNTDALQAVSVGESIAVAYRRSGTAIGLASTIGDPPKLLDAPKVASDATEVGAPALARIGDAVVVAWAERSAANEPWGVRWLRWQPGRAASPSRAFEVPPGGPGEGAMSPHVAALGEDAFFLTWTEGPRKAHRVRGQAVAIDGEPIGKVVEISPDDANAGQGKMVFAEDGRGFAVYFTEARGGFELAAVPITCGAR